MKNEFRSKNEYTPAVPSLTKVNNGRDIVKYINQQQPNSIQTLDISAHGGSYGIFFAPTPYPTTVENGKLREPKNNLYMSSYTQSNDRAGSGVNPWNNTYGAATLDDINFNVFADDAKIEFHSCNTAGDKWDKANEYMNMASVVSLKLYNAGKKNAVVIGHYEDAGPGSNEDYRQGERRVFYKGMNILTTNQKGNMSKKQI